MAAQNKVFYPDYWYTAVFILMAIVISCGILVAIKSTNDSNSLMMLLPALIQTFGWIICIPLVRAHFSVVVSAEGIRGPDGVIPFFSQKIKFNWKDMRRIEVGDYFLVSFAEIRNSGDGRKLMLPMGLDQMEEFKRLMNALSPEDCPLRLLFAKSAEGKKGVKTIKVQLSGVCKGPNEKSGRFNAVKLKQGKVLLFETKSDHNGKFFFETSLVPGEYSISMESMEYEGSLPLKIGRSYNNDLIIGIKRR